jgi:hypothetical protein
MAEMTSLVEAFRDLGPTIGEPQVDAVRSAAARQILEELKRIAGPGRPDQHLRDEAVSLILLRLVQRSHRNRLPDRMPASDEEVRAYLRTAFRNNLNEVRRSRGLDVSLDAVLEEPDEGGEPAEILEHRRARGELSEARRELFDVIVPTVAARKRRDGRDTFLVAIGELRAISEGRRSVDDLVKAELQGEAVLRERPEWRRGMNNVHKRFSRVLKDLVTEIDVLRKRGAIGEMRYHALRVTVDEIRLRGENEPPRAETKDSRT